MANWQTDARRAARRFGLDPNLFVRQMGVEAHGADLTSPAGALGPAQFMPATARGAGLNARSIHQRVPAYNAAAKLMAGYVNKYGSYRSALVAYNAGPGRVGGALPAETAGYVKTILGSGNGPTSTSPASGPSGVDNSTTTGAAGSDPGAQGSTLALLTALQQSQSQRPVSSGGLQAPSFSAAPRFAGAVPMSGGGPAPKQDPAALMSLIQTVGQDVGGQVTAGGVQPTSGGSQHHDGPTLGKVIVDPGANRAGVPLQPGPINFARRIAGIAGGPIHIGTGTNHSEYTVAGNVSDHWRGEGVDIPATGKKLIALGQAALIAAGMNPAKARQQTGGAYRVNGRQIIFASNLPGYGDHTTHLHVGLSRRSG